MTTYILEEHRVPNKIILAQKVLSNEPENSAWMPYQVKTIETHNFKSVNS